MNSTLVAPISVKRRPSTLGMNVGRIFWKEWRAQRAFWLGLFGLAIGLEILLIYGMPLLRASRQTDPVDQLRIHQWLVMVLACSFATGSAAIAFAGEVESKSKGLLQRLPARPVELLLGKLSWALIGSYALLCGLWLVGGLMLTGATGVSVLQADPRDVTYQINVFSHDLSLPAFFVLAGSLISLLMSEVLPTVLIGGVATAGLLAVPAIRGHLALQAAVLAVIALCDFALAGKWLRDPGAVDWGILPRLTLPRLARSPLPGIAPSATRRASARSAVAWRRAAGSLIWKDFRQAFLFCLSLLIVGLLALCLVPLSTRSGWNPGNGFISLTLIVFAPLLPGVAAMWTDRRRDAFRLLVNHGVAADGFLICKHLVWLSLSLAVFGALFWVDQFFLANYAQPRMSLWDAAVGVAGDTFGSPVTSVAGPVVVAAFHVVLLYALGVLLGLLLPGPVTAFFAGAILCFALGFCWAIVAALHIPFWWTVGLFPVIFLAVAWVRAADWLVGRDTLAARVKAAALFVVPMAGILAATAVYRVTEIPAVEIPPAVRALQSVPAPTAAVGKQSLFVEAMAVLNGNVMPNDQAVFGNGWRFATAPAKAWVKNNARARKLALDAAKNPPGSFPLQTGAGQADREVQWSRLQRMHWLTDLLLCSARELEARDQLDEALACYVAVARLGSDAARSPEFELPTSAHDSSTEALNWMQRWAVHPKQTTERIKKAIHEFEPFAESPLPLSADVQRNWRLTRQDLRSAIREHRASLSKNPTVSTLRLTFWLFPWELVRLERLTDAIYAADLSEAEAVESELRSPGFVTMTAERVAAWERTDVAPWKYERTTLALPETVNLPFRGGLEIYVNRMATERMDLIALALADYKREQHKLPESLEKLVPQYFQRLPIDPWTGREFDYLPNGLPGNLSYRDGIRRPGTPFLLSAGMFDTHIERSIGSMAVNTSVAGNTSFAIVSRFAPDGLSQNRVVTNIYPGPVVQLP